jgi:DNA-binding IclR family transcriptional regulator
MARPSTRSPSQPERARDRGSVQSVEVGMAVLAALADAGGEGTLGHIARSVEMPPAKAHRYLSSLIASGFVERVGELYALGPQALRVGLVALGRLDVVEAAASEMQRLRERIEASLLLAVWGTHGPTIVRWIDSARPVTVNVRVGSTMPVLRSATGLVFGAFMPDHVVAPLIAQELEERRRKGEEMPSPQQIAQRFARVRKDGLGFVAGEMLPGVLAAAAPVFDHARNLVAVITALGPAGFFDNTRDGRPAQELRRSAAALSAQFGYAAQDKVRMPRG